VSKETYYIGKRDLLLTYLSKDTDCGAAVVDRIGAESGRGGDGKAEGEEVLWLV
jgi:hypothetical protein